MLSVLLLQALLGLPPRANAWGIGSVQGQAASATAKVKVGPLVWSTEDMSATDKGAYVYIMADLFPYRDALKAAGKAALPARLAVDLIRDHFSALFPKAPYFKVAVVEFPERDEYDAPRWDKIQVLGRFVVRKQGRRYNAVPQKE